MFKTRRIRWACNTQGFDDSCIQDLARKRDRKRTLGGIKGYVVESIKMHRERSRMKGEDFVNLDGATDQWLSMFS
jgi:hypothetical protein